MIIPNIWKNKKCSKPQTNNYCYHDDTINGEFTKFGG